MQEKISKLKNLKLLFVEDEEDLLQIIEETLEKLSLNFLTAKNGEIALTLLDENPDVDYVVTDINMPVMNGLDMIKSIREKNIDVGIVIMSAHTETEYISQAESLGVQDYLLKPFDFIKFIDLMIEKSK